MTKTMSGALVAASTLMAATALADDSLFSGSAPQTEVAIGDPHDTYGTSTLTAHQVGSYQFQARDDSSPLANATGISRYFPTPGGVAIATPMLPNGAQVERIELSACDSDPANTVIVVFGTCSIFFGNCTTISVLSTGIPSTPGCTTFSTMLVPPVGTGNASLVLFIHVLTGPTANTTFQAVNLYYRLNVSPAPAVATFPNDVPTSHPFFRFIEALAAAGVTGGCGAGAYCPDAAVTRGQMAVFLATALGLHFPN